MLLSCKRTKRKFNIEPDKVEYLQKLLRQLDVENQLDELFNEEEIDRSDCIDIAVLINRQLEGSTIFEYQLQSNDQFLSNIVYIPHVISVSDDKSKIPKNIQPLSMTSLKFLSLFSDYIICTYGVDIE